MSNLERITVNLTQRSAAALELATGITGDSKTDIVNRAIRVYAYVEQVTSAGGMLMTVQDGKTEVLRLL